MDPPIPRIVPSRLARVNKIINVFNELYDNKPIFPPNAPGANPTATAFGEYSAIFAYYTINE
jgi:hypothetical protein